MQGSDPEAELRVGGRESKKKGSEDNKWHEKKANSKGVSSSLAAGGVGGIRPCHGEEAGGLTTSSRSRRTPCFMTGDRGETPWDFVVRWIATVG